MLNMNFEQQVIIDTNKMQWQESPAKGVWRKPLARAEQERGHATSVVKYDAGSQFSEHPHPKGEEIFVLEIQKCLVIVLLVMTAVFCL